MQYFGFYWGSPDSYNALELKNGGTVVRSFTGTELAAFVPFDANGNQATGAYINISGGEPGRMVGQRRLHI
jgi:hypothetical protein